MNGASGIRTHALIGGSCKTPPAIVTRRQFWSNWRFHHQKSRVFECLQSNSLTTYIHNFDIFAIGHILWDYKYIVLVLCNTNCCLQCYTIPTPAKQCITLMLKNAKAKQW